MTMREPAGREVGADLITESMRSLIGVDYPPVTFDVDRSAIRLWAWAVGFEDPVYYDEDHARSLGHPALPAPPGFLGHQRYGAGVDFGSGGPPIRGLNPALDRSLNGATRYAYRATVYAGDVLVATTRITDIAQRRGSIGDMLVITREATFRREGEPVAVMTATAINY
jgi:hypothetical protein